MNKKTLKILEYEKIINMLVDMASSEPAKRLCIKLQPLYAANKNEKFGN